MIHAYASRAHYAEHLRPIFDQLPERMRGEFWSSRRSQTWGIPLPESRRRPDGPVMVAAYVDARKLTGTTELIYVEHGAGQSYDGDPAGRGHGSYSGGSGLDAVALFLCPRQELVDRWVDVYATPSVVVGCPRLDYWHTRMVGRGVLGEGRTETERLLDLDRSEAEDRLRPGPGRSQTSASASGGVVDGDGNLAGQSRPRMPQPGDRLSGGDSLRAPSLRESLASEERDAEGKSRSLASHRPGKGVQEGPRIHAGEHLCDSGRSTTVPDLPEGTVVAFSFHWENPLVPESRSALAHYRRHLGPLIGAIRASGGEVIGHGHPRAWGALWRLWKELGVEAVPELDAVFGRASVFVADNTSALYEFASLDRPVVVLNAPWYRRDVEHGLRFWETIPGIQVDDGTDLLDAVAEAVADPPYLSAVRRDAVARTYASTDGHASERAVRAIEEIFDR